MEAYVLIQTDGDGSPIAETVRAIPGVVSAEDLIGPYDAIVLARTGSPGRLIDEILADIRNLPDVIRALPAPVLDSIERAGNEGEAA